MPHRAPHIFFHAYIFFSVAEMTQNPRFDSHQRAAFETMLIWGKLLAFAFLRLSTLVSAATLKPFTPVALPLEDIFDNQAASSDGSANFDGHGGSFDSQFLPTGPWIHDGIKVSLALILNLTDVSDADHSTTSLQAGGREMITSSPMARF